MIDNKNIVFVYAIALLIALPPFAIDTYMPSFGNIALSMNVSVSLLPISITAYFIGYGIGVFIWGSLSDRYGRKKILTIGVLTFIIATSLCLLTNNFLIFKFLRLIQGLSGSSTGIIAMAIIRDYYQGKELTKKMATINSIMMGAPLLAPIIGSAMMHYFKIWESIFVFLLCYGALLLIITLQLKESIKQKTQNKIIDLKLYTVHLKNKKFVLLSIIPGLSFASYFVFIGNSSVLLISFFHLSQFEYSFFFALNIFVSLIAQQILKKIVDRYKASNIIITCLTVALCGNILAFSFSHYVVNIYAFSLSITLICGSLSPIGTICASNAISAVKESFGTANALSRLFSFSMAGLATFVSSMFYGIDLMKAINLQQLCIISLIIIIIFYNLKSKHLS
ncbi:hypothetical protein CF386_08255 [Paraphotobacterium marinum]|uniref:Major facilitator superfamily (MFS) profile domain-containing protein n=1 Tax=Paraphotobacterium marinum TaxID=1755811 RepID=A0A220VFH1_9GAMM|nr:multidrug effflux MFS transporter [Paraphotobacterium marinum]ASK79051.1 hypothetical protein CF386_08255 [Paraphotobacterium marinum]